MSDAAIAAGSRSHAAAAAVEEVVHALIDDVSESAVDAKALDDLAHASSGGCRDGQLSGIARIVAHQPEQLAAHKPADIVQPWVPDLPAAEQSPPGFVPVAGDHSCGASSESDDDWQGLELGAPGDAVFVDDCMLHVADVDVSDIDLGFDAANAVVVHGMPHMAADVRLCAAPTPALCNVVHKVIMRASCVVKRCARICSSADMRAQQRRSGPRGAGGSHSATTRTPSSSHTLLPRSCAASWPQSRKRCLKARRPSRTRCAEHITVRFDLKVAHCA
jgi:hypothetical protein